MKKGIAVVAVLSLATSPIWTATGDDFDMEIVKAGTDAQHEIEIPAGGTVDLTVLLTTRTDGTQGWSLGVGLDADPGVSAAITSFWFDELRIEMVQEPTAFTLHWYTQDDPPQRMGPYGYYDLPIYGIEAGSFSLGEAVDMLNPSHALPATDDVHLIAFTVSAEADLAEGETAEARVEFTDDFGSTPFATVVAHGGMSIAPAVQTPATITLTGQTPFRRGDSNVDGNIDISDALYILTCMFAISPPALHCPVAADANDNNGVDMGDAIYILQFLFTNGPLIPPPYPDCGADPTPSQGSDLGECHYDRC